MTRFAVAMLVLETPEVLARVADHYTRLGAHEVVIYTDGPDGPADAVGALGGGAVRIVACDDAFWAATGGPRPDAIEQRQEAVFRHALAGTGADWLFLPDADEFLVCDGPLDALLGAIPDGIDVLRLPNAEAVWGPRDAFGAAFGCTHFRRPGHKKLHRALQYLVYGPRTARLLQAGLAGHAAGKQMLRTGRDYDLIKIHVTYRNGQEIGIWAQDVLPAPVPWVAHFDAVSLDRWRTKFARRHSGATRVVEARGRRQSQAQLIHDSGDRAGALCRQLYGLSWLQYSALRMAGLAFRHDVFTPR